MPNFTVTQKSGIKLGSTSEIPLQKMKTLYRVTVLTDFLILIRFRND